MTINFRVCKIYCEKFSAGSCNGTRSWHKVETAGFSFAAVSSSVWGLQFWQEIARNRVLPDRPLRQTAHQEGMKSTVNGQMVL